MWQRMFIPKLRIEVIVIFGRLAIIILTVVILLLIWLTARLSTIPLMEAQKLAEAGKPIPETGAKELRYLARNFNRMQEKLNANKEVDP